MVLVPSSPKKQVRDLRPLCHEFFDGDSIVTHEFGSVFSVCNAGFKGIWGSGLSLSASMAVRDSNEASWTQARNSFSVHTDWSRHLARPLDIRPILSAR